MEKINLFCIGTGNQFNNYHLKTIIQYVDLINCISLFDLDLKKTELVEAKIKNEFRINIQVNVFNNMVDFFDSINSTDDIENLCIISTPIHTHHDLIVKAINAKSHVYVDKPFVETLNQAKHLIEESKKKHSIIIIGAQRRFETIYSKILSNLPKIGSIKSIFFHNHGQFKSIFPDSIENDVFIGIGYHIIDTVVWLFQNSNNYVKDFEVVGAISQRWDLNPNLWGAFHALIIFHMHDSSIPIEISVSNFSPRDTISETFKIVGIFGEIRMMRDAIPRDQIPGKTDLVYWDEGRKEVFLQRLNDNDTYDRQAPLKQLFNNLLQNKAFNFESSAPKSLLTIEIIEAIKTASIIV